MKKLVLDPKTGKVLSNEDCTPRCGHDFCDKCGDCLHCFADNPCTLSRTGNHIWLVYADEKDE